MACEAPLIARTSCGKHACVNLPPRSPTTATPLAWMTPAQCKAIESAGTTAYRLASGPGGWVERLGNDVIISYKHDAARDEIKTERIFARLGATADYVQLACDDELQGKICFWRDVAHEHRGATLLQRPEREIERRRDAHDFKRHVGPTPTGEYLNCRHRIARVGPERMVRAKFDRIVEFAEIERFIDTPVKRYSSGMYVRLGFAVAAHINPHVLLVDEVLAVGDASFQNKCQLRIEELRRNGMTIVFVSHDMAIVERLCSRIFFLRQGEVQAVGPPHEVIRQYYDEIGLEPEAA